MTEVLSIGTWRNNAEMIADIARLPGYLTPPNVDDAPWTVFDATYGEGNFWTHWRPKHLTTNDLHKDAEGNHHRDDYRAFATAWANGWDVVVFDPPYKLNGTPALPDMDARYGTSRRTTRDEVLDDIRLGAIECYRVCCRRLFVKCMDQVEGGRKRWQTDIVTRAIEELGGRKLDRFDIPTAGIPQAKEGRVQRTSRAKHSTLLVFEKPKARR